MRTKKYSDYSHNMAKSKLSKRKKAFFTKYQIRILSEDFNEVGSFKLSKLDLYAIVGSIVLFTIMATVFVLSFTSLADLLPGFASPKTKETSLKNSIEIEKLKKEIRIKEQYVNNLRLVLQGKDPILLQTSSDSTLSKINTQRTKSDSLFRTGVEINENYKLAKKDDEDNVEMDYLYLFTPMKGEVVNKFNPKNGKNWIEIKYNQTQMMYAPFDGYVKAVSTLSNGNYSITIANKQGLEAKFSNIPKILKDKKQMILSGEIIGILTPKFKGQDLIYFSLKKGNEILDPLKNVDF